jgi:hypothetical protein
LQPTHTTEAGLRARIVKGELTPHRVRKRIYLDETKLREKFGVLFRPAGS